MSRDLMRRFSSMHSMEDLNKNRVFEKNPALLRQRRKSEMLGCSVFESESMESDSSQSSGSINFELEALQRYRRRRYMNRRESAASVSTSPDEDAYVMVLQNKTGTNEEVKKMTSLKNLYDVTFLVGEDKAPVHGFRAIIAGRSGFLQQLMNSFEKNQKEVKQNKKSKVKKTFSKLWKLSHVPNRQRNKDGRHKLVIPMEAYDPEAFQRLMTYIHCGTLTVDASTVIGLMNAAYMFGLPEVLQACWDFAMGCAVRTDNLLDLLSSARRYKDHKMTKELMREMKNRKDEYPDIRLYEETLDMFTCEESCSSPDTVAGAT